MIRVTAAMVNELVDGLMERDKQRVFNQSNNMHDANYATLFSDRSQLSKLLKDMLALARDQQQQRDVLPDCVVRFAPQPLQIARVDSIEHVLRYDRALLFRYKALLQKIEMYAATHLLF